MPPERLSHADGMFSAGLDLRAHVAELLARLSMFERVLANTPDVIARFDRQLRHLYVSPAVTQVTGLPADSFIGKTNRDLNMPDELLARWDTALLDVFATGEPRVITFSFPAPDGVRHYEARLVPEHGPDGAVETVLSVSRDVTRRAQVEAALRESEARFRLVLQDSPVMVFTQDRDLRYTWVYNPVPPSTVAALMGKTDAEVLPGAEGQQLMALKRQVLATCAGVRREMGFTAGERRLILDLKLEPIVGEGGAAAGVIGVAIDITERIRAEEQRIATERKLQETRRLESIAMLVGGIGHDFNNLLAVVLGNADLALVDLPADAPVRPSLHQIVIAARRAADLTRQLLTYAGHGRLDVRPLQLSEVIRNNAVLLEASVATTVRLEYHLAPELPPVLADESQLSQVLLNLIVNAAEAIGPRGGPVTIATAAQWMTAGDLARCRMGADRAPGQYVTLTVSDAGGGIDPALLDRIFEPFFTTKVGGRGLGLAVVQGIVKRHNGALGVESTPGRGASFTVLLPALQQPAALRPVLLASSTRVRWPGTVLVVDDEASVRLLIGRMVEHLGFAALLAADGLSALELVRARGREIACVLLDLTMPQADGLQAWRDMRLAAPELPVILMSAYRIDDVVREHTDLAAAVFLQKPFILEALEDVLFRVGALEGG